MMVITGAILNGDLMNRHDILAVTLLLLVSAYCLFEFSLHGHVNLVREYPRIEFLKRGELFLMAFLMLFLLTGCFGPPLPEKYGGIYLRAHGYSPELIAAIVQYGVLPTNRLDELCSIKNKDVRFLLARNPHLPFKYMQYYSNDEDDFIRSGLAHNTAISSGLVQKLFKDKSQTVCDSLAENSAVPQDVLLRLYRERKPALVCF
jgi:hypothetical protein